MRGLALPFTSGDLPLAVDEIAQQLHDARAEESAVRFEPIAGGLLHRHSPDAVELDRGFDLLFQCKRIDIVIGGDSLSTRGSVSRQ